MSEDLSKEVIRLIRLKMQQDRIEHNKLMKKVIITLVLCVMAFIGAIYLDDYLVRTFAPELKQLNEAQGE